MKGIVKVNKIGSLKNQLVFPVLAALASGTYPIVFYFSQNFTLINSWAHFRYFTLLFLLIPALLFVFFQWVFSSERLGSWQKYVVPFLNIFSFLILLKVCLYAGIQKKIIVGIFIVSVILTKLLYKHIQKIMILQLLIAMVGCFGLWITLNEHFNYSTEWTKQPDNIKKVVFKKKHNVYFIQPDGYVNFSELRKGFYNIENIEFEDFLTKSNFKGYPDFRSNYEATLASNSATFMMKHHYYGGSMSTNESMHAREDIISSNIVLDIFKSNGYRTHFLTELPYLLMNRPKLGYDVCNFSYNEFPYIGTGLEPYKDILEPLKEYANIDSEIPKFFFIEIFNPKHIDGLDLGENTIELKRIVYKENLEDANVLLTNAITFIKKNDPTALVIIMADHGGYVGMKTTREGGDKTQNRDKIYSIFSSLLSIHWPNDKVPNFDVKLKTPVNLFRIIFSYLSENETYLTNLEENSSYIQLNTNTEPGVYRYIDGSGAIDFKVITPN